jgi:hypothetical protein
MDGSKKIDVIFCVFWSFGKLGASFTGTLNGCFQNTGTSWGTVGQWDISGTVIVDAVKNESLKKRTEHRDHFICRRPCVVHCFPFANHNTVQLWYSHRAATNVFREV